MPKKSTILASALTLMLCSAQQADAFRACDMAADDLIEGAWPAYANDDLATNESPGSAGTRRWDFHYAFTDDGFIISDIKYGTGTTKYPVADSIGLRYVMTRYPHPNHLNPSFNTTACGPLGFDSPGAAFNDTPKLQRLKQSAAEFHCAEVPTTVCDAGERRCEGGSCVGTSTSCSDDEDCIMTPHYMTVSQFDDCTGDCQKCRGVCAHTQARNGQVEIGTEVASDSSQADIVLTAMDHYGGYQFVTRYRFTHDGKIYPSIRFGGIYQEQQHDHIAYWRMVLDPRAQGQDVPEVCTTGSCNSSSAGWESVYHGCRSTQSLPQEEGYWRFYDVRDVVSGTPTQEIRVRGGPNDGTPDVCAFYDKDYCVATTNDLTDEGLRARGAEPGSQWFADECRDGLTLQARQDEIDGADLREPKNLTFYYLAHHNAHSPCQADEQNFCGPGLGERAMGPELALVGNWD